MAGIPGVGGAVQIHAAQTEYKSTYGRFADKLAALGPDGSGLIAARLAGGSSSGYVFRFETTAAGYTISASPVSSRNGRRTFFSDQSLEIRENWGPDPATAQSRELK